MAVGWESTAPRIRGSPPAALTREHMFNHDTDIRLKLSDYRCLRNTR
jgi:hypothetical protein